MYKHLTVKELPESERPYERCERYGASVLTDSELLAVIIRSGSREERSIDLANRVLNYPKRFKGLVGLNYMTLDELTSIKGIGNVKAIQLLCVAELTKRMAKATRPEGIRFHDPGAVAEYYMQDMRHLVREQILLVFLDSKTQFLGDLVISSGTINSTIITPREIFLSALEYQAAYILLLHNHPSGDPAPSKEDMNTTRRIKDCGALIGIELIDHIIIGDNKYISFRERGILE